MSFRRHRYLTIHCDVCGRPLSAARTATLVQSVFAMRFDDTVAAVVTAIAEDWTIDGPGHTCPACQPRLHGPQHPLESLPSLPRYHPAQLS